MAGSLGIVSSVVGIGSGVSSLLGGSSGGSSAAADPFAAYRGQYAQQLQDLMNNPASVASFAHMFPETNDQDKFRKELTFTFIAIHICDIHLKWICRGEFFKWVFAVD